MTHKIEVTEVTAEQQEAALQRAQAAGCRSCGSTQFYKAQLGGKWPDWFIATCSSCPVAGKLLN